MLRSSRAEVRNPILALPAAQALASVDPRSRVILHRLLLDISRDARARAQESWKRNKGPMALYWKVVSVYARHIAAALNRPAEAKLKEAA